MSFDDLVDYPEELYEAISQTRCEAPWCTAKKRKRYGKSKYSEGELRFPDECGDKAGGYGMVHESRLATAKKFVKEDPDVG